MTDLIRPMIFYAGPLRIDIGGGAPCRAPINTKEGGKWITRPRKNGRVGWEVAVRKKASMRELGRLSEAGVSPAAGGLSPRSASDFGCLGPAFRALCTPLAQEQSYHDPR